MINLIKKLFFLWKKPGVVIVRAQEGFLIDTLAKILKINFQIEKISKIGIPWVTSQNKVLIFCLSALSEAQQNILDFIIKKSSRPVIIFSGFAKEDLERVINKSPEKLYVIVGAEEKEIKGPVVKVLTCGLEGSADLLATDINVSGDEINFKLNYEGGIIPFWVPAPAKKEQIHSVLLAVAAGVLQKINLVDISQAIRIIK